MSTPEPLVWRTTITAVNAPARLRGLELTATLSEGHMDFLVDMPDDPTGQELGYVKYLVGEFMDAIRRETGVESSMVFAGLVDE